MELLAELDALRRMPMMVYVMQLSHNYMVEPATQRRQGSVHKLRCCPVRSVGVAGFGETRLGGSDRTDQCVVYRFINRISVRVAAGNHTGTEEYISMREVIKQDYLIAYHVMATSFLAA